MYAEKKVLVEDLDSSLQDHGIVYVEEGECQAQRHDIVIRTAKETGIPVIVSSVWSASYLSKMYPDLIVYPLDIEVLKGLNHNAYLLNDVHRNDYLGLKEATSPNVVFSGFIKE